MSGKLVLVGGELEPSARGHAGAGNFSDKATPISLAWGGAKLEVGEAMGPSARGWSAGGAWRGQRMVGVGGLTGDDTSPVRLMDVWMGEL